GMPAVDYTVDELIYMPRNPRPHKVYGYSPVEQIVLTVNIALRRALSQLQYYTEGNVPEALIGVPASWTPDQIRQFQLYWDSLMEGNLATRRHARFIPGDMKYQPTRDAVLKDPYDEWLARIACYAFSVAPTPFISQVNRATAESAQDSALAEGLAPLKSWVKHLIDRILARELAMPDLEFAWAEARELDPAAQAGIDQIYVSTGVKSVDEVRASLGLAPIGYGNAVMGLQPYPLGPGANGGSNGAAISPGAVGKVSAPVLKYSPDQPRVPAGQAGGGQWTSEGDGNGNGDGGDSNGGDGGNGDGGASHDPFLSDGVYRPGEGDNMGVTDLVDRTGGDTQVAA
ncbi:MAG TPA: phage portal protein, partial [Alphaproteobacteria bacterium]|nr:phage portal protein [Alphaproteobacteria bacterium]